MNGRGRLLVFVGAACLAVGASPAAAATTRVVDDDGFAVSGNCDVGFPFVTYASIQSAINASSPGDTIEVCPGIYREYVTVNKTLTITGPSLSDLVDGCEFPPSTDPTTQAVIRPPLIPLANHELVHLSVPGITFESFVIENNLTGPGVLADQPASFSLESNLIQNNAIGLEVDTTAPSTVTGNCFVKNNALPGHVLYGTGRGIFTLGNPLKNLTIDANGLSGHASAGLATSGRLRTATGSASRPTRRRRPFRRFTSFTPILPRGYGSFSRAI
jgi:hypothetical protein